MRNWTEATRWRNYMKTPSSYTTTLNMHFESPENNGSNLAQVYRGWFTAPASAKHRFMTVCDDHCAMRLGSKPGSSKEVTELLNVDAHSSSKRNYRYEDG
jgi:hypothetical protein